MDHTGPNTQAGGVPNGFARVGYQVFTESAVNHEPIAAARKQIARNTTQLIQDLDIRSFSRAVICSRYSFNSNMLAAITDFNCRSGPYIFQYWPTLFVAVLLDRLLPRRTRLLHVCSHAVRKPSLP